MSDIQDRITKVKEYFKEMQVTQVEDTPVIYVVVSFPDRWIIDDGIEEKFDVSVRNGKEPCQYYFCAEMEVGFDKVFDAVDYCIAGNKDAMERAQIYQQKINELKAIFGSKARTISELKSLEFTFPPQKKVKTKKAIPAPAENRQLTQEDIKEIYSDEYKK